VIGRVCWFVRSLVYSLVHYALFFLEKYNSDFNEISHR